MTGKSLWRTSVVQTAGIKVPAGDDVRLELSCCNAGRALHVSLFDMITPLVAAHTNTPAMAGSAASSLRPQY